MFHEERREKRGDCACLRGRNAKSISRRTSRMPSFTWLVLALLLSLLVLSVSVSSSALRPSERRKRWMPCVYHITHEETITHCLLPHRMDEVLWELCTPRFPLCRVSAHQRTDLDHDAVAPPLPGAVLDPDARLVQGLPHACCSVVWWWWWAGMWVGLDGGCKVILESTATETRYTRTRRCLQTF